LLMPFREIPVQAMTCCSRFCNGQSTQEPQGSTGLGEETVSYSIKTTYFHSISTDFHKRCDLFWDRWSHLHNFRRLNALRNGHWGSWFAFGVPLGTPLEVHPKLTSDVYSGRCWKTLCGFMSKEPQPATAGRFFRMFRGSL